MRVALTGLALTASQPAAAEADPFVDAARPSRVILPILEVV